jgi:OOP family OmpA-OmpF porin
MTMTQFFPLRAASVVLPGLLMLVLPALVQAQALTPPAARISDRAIHADYQTYEQAQARIQALNAQGRPLRDYHLAKAQCWLDVSLHEYSRNDRSAFPQEALDQSLALVGLMEQKAANLLTDTVLVNQAERLRPDLWGQADALKAHAGRACAAQRVACAEVELVHAGNEYRQQGWRHARPYIQMAEDQLQQASAQAAACVPPPAPVAAVVPTPVPVVAAVAPPPPPPPPVARAPQPLEFQANVLFNHNRAGLADARALTVERLAVAVSRAREAGMELQQIQLVGHADRTGKPAANMALAQARVDTVRDYLLSKGIAASLIQNTAGAARRPGPARRAAAPCRPPIAQMMLWRAMGLARPPWRARVTLWHARIIPAAPVQPPDTPASRAGASEGKSGPRRHTHHKRASRQAVPGGGDFSGAPRSTAAGAVRAAHFVNILTEAV